MNDERIVVILTTRPLVGPVNTVNEMITTLVAVYTLSICALELVGVHTSWNKRQEVGTMNRAGLARGI